MNSGDDTSIARLRGPILRSVSRSFYLSIRLLPQKLRDPIALAYLLARATDTIADTAQLSAELRAEVLADLAGAIQGAPASNEKLREFAELQNDAAERALIEALPACLDWLAAMPATDCADIRDVLLRINQGQTLDVQLFADVSRVAALQTAADLDRYTYLVAGCVGEFWTNICCRHLPNFSARAKEEMVSLGVEYGKGLQLINVLRDLGDDLRHGRCYLPEDELRRANVTPNELLQTPERTLSMVDSWQRRAEQGIAAGIEYASAIRPFRVRLATALPALIGARTLALMRNAGVDVLARKVKIQRAEVRQIIFAAVANRCSPKYLRSALTNLSS